MATVSGFLLDTCIVIHLIRGNKIGQAVDAKHQLRTIMSHCTISVVTIGELHAFARKLRWGTAKITELQNILEELVCIDINHPQVFEAYAEIDHATESHGRPMGKNDLWIAATARASGMTLLTTDKDFDYLSPAYIDRIWIDPDNP